MWLIYIVCFCDVLNVFVDQEVIYNMSSFSQVLLYLVILRLLNSSFKSTKHALFCRHEYHLQSVLIHSDYRKHIKWIHFVHFWDRLSTRRNTTTFHKLFWLSPFCSISVWFRTQDINMPLPSLPSLCFGHTGLNNNSCKCHPDHYCLSSIPSISCHCYLAIHFIFILVYQQ